MWNPENVFQSSASGVNKTARVRGPSAAAAEAISKARLPAPSDARAGELPADHFSIVSLTSPEVTQGRTQQQVIHFVPVQLILAVAVGFLFVIALVAFILSNVRAQFAWGHDALNERESTTEQNTTGSQGVHRARRMTTRLHHRSSHGEASIQDADGTTLEASLENTGSTKGTYGTNATVE